MTGVTAVGHTASAAAVGAGGVWVADAADGKVTRLDPATGAVTATTRRRRPHRLGRRRRRRRGSRTASAGPCRASIRSANQVVHTIHVGGSPDHVAVAAGRVWVTVQAGAAPVATVAGGTLRILQQTDFNSTDPAQMASYGPQAAQLEYATCAKLLDYPDHRAPQGTRLVPEVAAAMPAVSRRRSHVHVHRATRIPLLTALRPTGHRASLPARVGALPQSHRARPSGHRLRLRRHRRVRRRTTAAGRATSQV